MAIDVMGTLYWETGLPVHQSGRVEGAVPKYVNRTTTDLVLTNDNGRFRRSTLADLRGINENAQRKVRELESAFDKAGEVAQIFGVIDRATTLVSGL